MMWGNNPANPLQGPRNLGPSPARLTEAERNVYTERSAEPDKGPMLAPVGDDVKAMFDDEIAQAAVEGRK